MTEDLLPYTLATWVFTLHVGGVAAADPAIVEACHAILAARESVGGNAAAQRLVARVAEVFRGRDPAAVEAGARALYGDRVRTDLGRGDRELRTARVRKFQFAVQLPWLARIWERGEDGVVAPRWHLVERMTDRVSAADPNPWNDVDETKHWPLHDFHVLWELDACTSVHVAA